MDGRFRDMVALLRRPVCDHVQPPLVAGNRVCVADKDGRATALGV